MADPEHLVEHPSRLAHRLDGLAQDDIVEAVVRVEVEVLLGIAPAELAVLPARLESLLLTMPAPAVIAAPRNLAGSTGKRLKRRAG
jgi:hypothetical protein